MGIMNELKRMIREHYENVKAFGSKWFSWRMLHELFCNLQHGRHQLCAKSVGPAAKSLTHIRGSAAKTDTYTCVCVCIWTGWKRHDSRNTTDSNEKICDKIYFICYLN